MFAGGQEDKDGGKRRCCCVNGYGRFLGRRTCEGCEGSTSILQSRALDHLPAAVACSFQLMWVQKVILGVFFMREIQQPIEAGELYRGLGGRDFCEAKVFHNALQWLSGAKYLEEVRSGTLSFSVFYKKGWFLSVVG